MTFTSRNPHDPADVIGEWQPAGEAEVAAAVDRAAAAARGWADTRPRPAPQALGAAADALAQRAAEVTALVIREVGKPRSEARGRWPAASRSCATSPRPRCCPTARPCPRPPPAPC